MSPPPRASTYRRVRISHTSRSPASPASHTHIRPPVSLSALVPPLSLPSSSTASQHGTVALTQDPQRAEGPRTTCTIAAPPPPPPLLSTNRRCTGGRRMRPARAPGETREPRGRRSRPVPRPSLCPTPPSPPSLPAPRPSPRPRPHPAPAAHNLPRRRPAQNLIFSSPFWANGSASLSAFSRSRTLLSFFLPLAWWVSLPFGSISGAPSLGK